MSAGPVSERVAALLAALPFDLPAGTPTGDGDVRAEDLDVSSGRPAFRLVTPHGETPVRLLLPVDQLDAVLAVARRAVAAGVPLWELGPALNRVPEDAVVRGADR